MTSAHPDAELRAWAVGDKGREAATELLIRTGLAGAGEPWILHDTGWGVYAVDYTAVPYGRPGLTDSQNAVLLLAASLADNALIDLQAIARELDYDHLLLAITAITHAAGYHRPTVGIHIGGGDDGMPRIVRRPPLMSWGDDHPPPASTP